MIGDITMDELAKTLIVQAPAIGVLLVFTITLYRDMRLDAKTAFEQREETIRAIEALTNSLDALLNKK